MLANVEDIIFVASPVQLILQHQIIIRAFNPHERPKIVHATAPSFFLSLIGTLMDIRSSCSKLFEFKLLSLKSYIPLYIPKKIKKNKHERQGFPSALLFLIKILQGLTGSCLKLF